MPEVFFGHFVLKEGFVMNTKLRKLVLIAMFSAVAYLLVYLVRIPIVPAVPFLRYEPKDVMIVIGGFILGPMASVLISLIVSFFEFLTISTTGPIGMLMNFLSSTFFACTAAIIYKKKRTLKGAVIGLATGTVLTVVLMLLWNYLVSPIYMGIAREAIVKLLLPGFLPFNLIKGIINTTITMLLYKPIVTALRKAKLAPSSEQTKQGKYLGVALACMVILISVALFILIFQGVI